jgi:predicted nucleic acid-binding protein
MAGALAMMVADTDVLIDYLAGDEPAASRVTLELEHGLLQTTAITRAELLRGARTPRQLKAATTLLEALPTLPLDARAADRAASIARALDGEGQGIGMADALIAGIVLTHGGLLLTRNRRHFARIPELRLSMMADVEPDPDAG